MTSTPLDLFYRWEATTPDHPYLRQPINNEWKVYSYKAAGAEVRKLAAALRSLGLPPGSSIAILSKNCAHWFIADLAIMMAGHVSVPLYPTLSAAGIQPILEHSEAKIIFLGKLDNYESQRAGIPDGVRKISFPYYGPQDGTAWNDLVADHTPLQEDQRTDPQSLATIMYSSGTTGTPKGVMITSGSLGFVGECVARHLQIKKPERFFSYLPLSHIAERAMVQMVVLASGSTVSFAESLDTFAQNLQHEQPTLFGGVPRIWSKFQEGVLEKLPQPKLDRLLSIPLVSFIIKRTIQKKLGLAKARVIVSGAAPIPISLLEWYKKIGVDIREMYGMTENTAFSHASFQKIKIGTVGEAWPEVEVKLESSGEVLVRHAAMMKGYLKDAETTAAVFTTDGFLRTGDTGTIDEEGFLTITGRVRDQFKTDKAKFVAPAPIELKLLSNTDIDQVCVVGKGIPQPIALIVLSSSGRSKPENELMRSLTNTFEAINKTAEDYERLGKGVILRDGWTIENGFLTPTLKIKRSEVEKIHAHKYPLWYGKEGKIIRE